MREIPKEAEEISSKHLNMFAPCNKHMAEKRIKHILISNIIPSVLHTNNIAIFNI